MLELHSRIESGGARKPVLGGGTAVGLIGPGNVGSRVLARIAEQQPERLALHALTNSRRMVLSPTAIDGEDWASLLSESERTASLDDLVDYVASIPADRHVLIDVTASPEVAARHSGWLARGFEVVTANKWAAAGELAFAPDLHNPRYRHATTVGAGLPILQTLRGLRHAGDRLLSIEGVLSGTLSYLTSQVAAGRAFSESLVEAHRIGMTEPDPRLDLGGLDVARKLVIAARAAGLALQLEEVVVDSLVPASVAELDVPGFLAQTEALEQRWCAAVEASPGEGLAMVHAGRVDIDGEGRVQARVGLRRVAPDHPLAAATPGDNIVSIRTAAYRDQPIWIRGPGAGADITALQVYSELVQAVTY